MREDCWTTGGIRVCVECNAMSSILHLPIWLQFSRSWRHSIRFDALPNLIFGRKVLIHWVMIFVRGYSVACVAHQVLKSHSNSNTNLIVKQNKLKWNKSKLYSYIYWIVIYLLTNWLNLYKIRDVGFNRWEWACDPIWGRFWVVSPLQSNEASTLESQISFIGSQQITRGYFGGT